METRTEDVIKELAIRIRSLRKHEVTFLRETIGDEALEKLRHASGPEVLRIVAQCLWRIEYPVCRMELIRILFGGAGEDVGEDFFKNFL